MKELWTALITPFDKQKAIDFEALDALVEAQLAAGVDGFVVCGTTGETPTLEPQERVALIKRVLAHVQGRCKVYAGVGTNCTLTTIRNIMQLEPFSLDGYLLVTPYYNRPSQEGLFHHFQAAAAVTKKTIMLYHVPKRTGSAITLPLLKRLIHACPNIRSLKYADADYDDILAIRAFDPHFRLYSGDDDSCFAAMRDGMDGVVSVLSHLQPLAMRCVMEKPDEGLEAQLRQLAHYCFIDASPAPLKYLLAQQGVCQNELRLPLCPVDTDTAALLKREAVSLNDTIYRQLRLQ